MLFGDMSGKILVILWFLCFEGLDTFFQASDTDPIRIITMQILFTVLLFDHGINKFCDFCFMLGCHDSAHTIPNHAFWSV